MRFSIGIITAKNSVDNIRKVADKMCRICDIEYLSYTLPQELSSLYLNNFNSFDGFLFSGTFPFDYISHNVTPVTKPYKILDINDRDYYWIIAKLFATRPGIDFSRVYFDKPSDPTPFENVFTTDNAPVWANTLQNKLYSQQLQEFYEAAFVTYNEYWRSGKVDLIVTRLTNIAPLLEENGIHYILLSPSPATIMEYFNSLVNDIQDYMLKSSLIACCTIRIAKDDVLEEDYIELETALNNFNSLHNKSCVVRRNGIYVDLLTSSLVLNEFTNYHATCLVTSVLYEVLSFSTYIGWGIGFDIATAHQNARRAIQESHRDSRKYTYLVNDKNEMIGPLTGDRTVSYIIKPNAKIQSLARGLGISPINLEKIISLKEKKQMQEFSSTDLVYYLNITPRSATRILNKLAQAKCATPVRTAFLSDKGRPSTIYRIDLMDVNGD